MLAQYLVDHPNADRAPGLRHPVGRVRVLAGARLVPAPASLGPRLRWLILTLTGLVPVLNGRHQLVGQLRQLGVVGPAEASKGGRDIILPLLGMRLALQVVDARRCSRVFLQYPRLYGVIGVTARCLAGPLNARRYQRASQRDHRQAYWIYH